MSHRPRITGGRLKGRPLPFPVPQSARPTSSRVREAMFSIVGHDLGGLRILDAYGGSGLLGIEASSRGGEVVVVERNRKAANTIRQNFEGLGIAASVQVGDVHLLISQLGLFDGVLADPPYKMPPAEALQALQFAVGSWLLLETDSRATVPKQHGTLALSKSRLYGGTAVHIYGVMTEINEGEVSV